MDEKVVTNNSDLHEQSHKKDEIIVSNKNNLSRDDIKIRDPYKTAMLVIALLTLLFTVLGVGWGLGKGKLEEVNEMNTYLREQVENCRGVENSNEPEIAPVMPGEVLVRIRAAEQSQLFDESHSITVDGINFRGPKRPQQINFGVNGPSDCSTDIEFAAPGLRFSSCGLNIVVEGISLYEGTFRVSLASGE